MLSMENAGSCASKVTDEEWELMVPLIPPGKSGGGKRTVIMREVVNGLMYVLRLHSLCQVQDGRFAVQWPKPGALGDW